MGNTLENAVEECSLSFKGAESDQRKQLKELVTAFGIQNLRHLYETDEEISEFFFENNIIKAPANAADLDLWIEKLEPENLQLIMNTVIPMLHSKKK